MPDLFGGVVNELFFLHVKCYCVNIMRRYCTWKQSIHNSLIDDTFEVFLQIVLHCETPI